MLIAGLCMSVSVFAQQMTVTGVVKDPTGEPVIGANVIIKGTTNGTVTDIDGKFLLSASKGDIISVSFIGYKMQELPAASDMNIILAEDSQMLENVVVIGYGTVKKNDATGSVIAIKPDEKNRGLQVSPQDMLMGKVAGVSVASSTGQPGSSSSIRIRGGSSLSAKNDPLVVIDGVIMGNSAPDGLSNPLSTINPSDIESFTVLKDASATAIYGSRASNGVIIITTKKAKEGQTLVNINTSFGFKKVVDKVKLVNGSQFKELYNEQLANQKDDPFDYTGWDANTDWQDEIFQTAFITNNNISITGASPKHSFYLGVGYSYEQGNIEHEKFSKVTINASNDYKITDFLKVGFQFNGARMLPADSKQVLNALRATPIAPVYNNEYGLYTALPEFQKAQINNPMVDVELKANTTKAENYRASGNIYGEVDFLKHSRSKRCSPWIMRRTTDGHIHRS